jgi:hypothetical protein
MIAIGEIYDIILIDIANKWLYIYIQLESHSYTCPPPKWPVLEVGAGLKPAEGNCPTKTQDNPSWKSTMRKSRGGRKLGESRHDSYFHEMVEKLSPTDKFIWQI